MANKTFTFPDGGKCYVEYSGEYDNIVRVSADPNEGEDRELTLTFQTYANGISVQRKVVQEGTAPYTFDLGLITSSERNVATQLGWQDANGANVAQPFTLNGETYNANTANYWTNGTDNHVYNVTAERAVGKEYVFYANTTANYANITSATLKSTLPAVNLAGCFNQSRNMTSFEGSGLNVANMASTFNNCHALTSLNLGNFTGANVTSMSNTFNNCYQLTSLNLGNFTGANVTSMSNTFNNCHALTSLNLGNFTGGNVTSMVSTFQNCYQLTSLNLGNFTGGNVTSMASTFNGCNRLATLNLGNFTGENVTSMVSTFNGCNRLATLNLGNFTGENVTSMVSTFYNCTNLTSLNLDNFTGENVTSLASTFQNCYQLTSLNLGNFTGGNVTSMASTFNGCYNLTTHGINSWTGANANCYNMFRMCNSLDDIQIHWNITCAAYMFANRNSPLNVYASTVTNAYNAIYVAMGNKTTNSNWNVTLYELNE